jgi:TRAP transporter TAXI family solute receptor
MASTTGPRVDLTMVGDWGNANFHVIVGWLAAHMRWRSAPRSTFTLRTGTGYRDNIELLGMGEADLAITTPRHMGVEWPRLGKHFYADRAYPYLRTLGYLPQDDRLVLAVRADTGITSFADIRERKFPLKVATPLRDANNLTSYAIDLAFKYHGIEPSDIIKWGGAFLEHDHPRICLLHAIKGEANAVFNEAIMVPQWHELVEKVPMRFIPMEQKVLDKLAADYGLKAGVFPKGRLKADRDIACIDWSDWALLVRDDMPEDLAYRITAIMVEERAEMESRYRHLPLDRSPMTYPIDPYSMWQGIGAPLHPGAERYYREHGYMKSGDAA